MNGTCSWRERGISRVDSTPRTERSADGVVGLGEAFELTWGGISVVWVVVRDRLVEDFDYSYCGAVRGGGVDAAGDSGCPLLRAVEVVVVVEACWYAELACESVLLLAVGCAVQVYDDALLDDGVEGSKYRSRVGEGLGGFVDDVDIGPVTYSGEDGVEAYVVNGLDCVGCYPGLPVPGKGRVAGCAVVADW